MPLPLRMCGLLCALSLCVFTPLLSAKTLRITSTPAGATVELDGVIVGKTPFERDFPGGYFRRPLTVFEKRLGHPVRLRLTLSGYVTQEVVLTSGPKQWLDLHHNNRGEFWLFKSDQFDFDLLPVPSDERAMGPATFHAHATEPVRDAPLVVPVPAQLSIFPDLPISVSLRIPKQKTISKTL